MLLTMNRSLGLQCLRTYDSKTDKKRNEHVDIGPVTTKEVNIEESRVKKQKMNESEKNCQSRRRKKVTELTLSPPTSPEELQRLHNSFDLYNVWIPWIEQTMRERDKERTCFLCDLCLRCEPLKRKVLRLEVYKCFMSVVDKEKFVVLQKQAIQDYGFVDCIPAVSMALFESKQWNKLKAYLETAKNEQTDNVNLFLNLGRMYMMLEEREAVSEMLRQGSLKLWKEHKRQSEEYFSFLSMFAHLEYKYGLFEEGRKLFQKIISKKGNNSGTRISNLICSP